MHSEKHTATTIPNRLLAVLRNRIRDRDLTLSDVAVHLKTTHATVSRLLNGHTKLSVEDVSQIATLLGTTPSQILKEAESFGGKPRIAEGMEQYICSDARIYSIFVSLNYPISVESLITQLGLEKKFVQGVLSKFISASIVGQPKKGTFQLTDAVRELGFGQTADFYRLKAQIYEEQSMGTYENLSRGAEFWKDKDDSMRVVRLSQAQALSVARQLETISAQLKTMDEMNEMSSQENDTNGLDSLSKIHAIFLALKPIDPAFLKRLSSIKGNA